MISTFPRDFLLWFSLFLVICSIDFPSFHSTMVAGYLFTTFSHLLEYLFSPFRIPFHLLFIPFRAPFPLLSPARWWQGRGSLCSEHRLGSSLRRKARNWTLLRRCSEAGRRCRCWWACNNRPTSWFEKAWDWMVKWTPSMNSTP